MYVINWIITKCCDTMGVMANDPWKHFETWCREHHDSALPADWTTLVHFLRDQTARGHALLELEATLRSVAAAHRARGVVDPTTHERVRNELQALESAADDAHTAASTADLVPSPARSSLPAVELLRELPEEEIWLQGQRSAGTRRNYKADVAHFVAALGIRSRDELRLVDRAAVIAWMRKMESQDPPARPRTIRRRLSALSSLFTHLVDRGLVDLNPVREIRRPRVNRRRGETKSFSKKQARALLDAPELIENPTTEAEVRTNLRAVRDRALLAVGLQVGARRSEIARLAVKDFHQNQGFWSLHFIQKGGEDLSVSVNPAVAQRIHEYLRAAGHADDHEGPLFRPLRHNRKGQEERRHMDSDMVDRVLRKYARKALGITTGFSAHSMRATFITTALDNGASLEDVQRDVGHADPSTTKLYDRRGHNPEKSASFFANY